MTSIDDVAIARQQAARLAAITEIRAVRLMRSSAEIIHLPANGPFLSYQLASTSAVEYEPGSESFVVHGNYSLTINSRPTADLEDSGPQDLDSTVARIEFEQAALFVMDISNERPPEPDELNAYAISTGQFALHPYAREYISDLTARLGLPPLTVGVLRMPLPAERADG